MNQRIIKYRAWHKELSEMYDWDELQVKGKWWTYPEYELMQFTGLHDKNGKEIYEGDILRYTIDEDNGYRSFKHVENVEVRFDMGNYRFGANEHSWWHDLRGSSSEMSGNKNLSVEIIGDIYESPELLK